jgi:hypothetical protein
MNLYGETSWQVEFIPIHPNPDCSKQQKIFEKCCKVFPRYVCNDISGFKKCKEQPTMDCILRKQEFDECLKNGCSEQMCDKRTQYLTLCVKDKAQ